jgi:hypothetical protein
VESSEEESAMTHTNIAPRVESPEEESAMTHTNIAPRVEIPEEDSAMTHTDTAPRVESPEEDSAMTPADTAPRVESPEEEAVTTHTDTAPRVESSGEESAMTPADTAPAVESSGEESAMTHTNTAPRVESSEEERCVTVSPAGSVSAGLDEGQGGSASPLNDRASDGAGDMNFGSEAKPWREGQIEKPRESSGDEEFPAVSGETDLPDQAGAGSGELLTSEEPAAPARTKRGGREKEPAKKKEPVKREGATVRGRPPGKKAGTAAKAGDAAGGDEKTVTKPPRKRRKPSGPVLPDVLKPGGWPMIKPGRGKGVAAKPASMRGAAGGRKFAETASPSPNLAGRDCPAPEIGGVSDLLNGNVLNVAPFNDCTGAEDSGPGPVISGIVDSGSGFGPSEDLGNRVSSDRPDDGLEPSGSSCQDQDAGPSVSLQDAGTSVSLQDAGPSVSLQDAGTSGPLQDAGPSVSLQDAGTSGELRVAGAWR